MCINLYTQIFTYLYTLSKKLRGEKRGKRIVVKKRRDNEKSINWKKEKEGLSYNNFASADTKQLLFNTQNVSLISDGEEECWECHL